MNDCKVCCLVSCLVGMVVGGIVVVSNKKIEQLLKKGKEMATEKINEMKQKSKKPETSEKSQESK